MKRIIYLAILLLCLIPTLSHAYRDYYGPATARDGYGHIIVGATVTVYLAGTSTLASIYDSSTNTVASTSILTGADGTYSFYVDRLSYGASQKFKVIISKAGYSSNTIDNLAASQTILGTYTLTGSNTVSHHLTIPQGVIYDGSINFTVQPTIGDYKVFASTAHINIPLAKAVWFGAVGDGSTNDVAKWDAAVTATYNATTGLYGTVIGSAGKRYRVNSTLNWAKKPNLIIKDAYFLGYAGAAKPTFDAVGSRIRIDNITIDNYTSTICGLLGAAGTLDASGTWHISTGQFGTVLTDFTCTYPWASLAYVTGPSANSNLGLAGIVNIGGENVTYNNMYVEANIPFIGSVTTATGWIAGDVSSNYVASSDYATLPTSWTLGVQVFTGDQEWIANGFVRPVMAWFGGNAISFGTGYLRPAETGNPVDGTFKKSLQAHSVSNSKFHYLAEGADVGLLLNTMKNSEVQFQLTEASAATTIGAIELYGSTAYIEGNTFRVGFDVAGKYVLKQSSDVAFSGLYGNNDVYSTQTATGYLVDPTLTAYMNYHSIWGRNQGIDRRAFPYPITWIGHDASPSVANSGSFLLSQDASTNVTWFKDGYEGKEFVTMATNTNTTLINSSVMVLTGGTNLLVTSGTRLKFIFLNSAWRQL